MFWRVFVNRTRSIIQRLIRLGSQGEAEVRALAFHHCGPGSNPAVDAKCGLSFTLFFSLPERFFAKYSFLNSNSTRNGRRRTTTWMCYLWIIIHYSSVSSVKFMLVIWNFLFFWGTEGNSLIGEAVRMELYCPWKILRSTLITACRMFRIFQQ